MQKTIIADASCLILLHKIDSLFILNSLFGTVVITEEILLEFGYPHPAFFHIQNPEDINFQNLIEKSIDKGEASAIALAVELAGSLLIIDDLKGRKFAQKLGLTITGSLGILLEAKLAGIIPSVKAMLLKIHETNFRITWELEEKILKKGGEL